MCKDKGGIKRNTNMLFMKRFISSRMVTIVQIRKGASFEREKRNDCVILSHTETHTSIHHIPNTRRLVSRKSRCYMLTVC